MVRELAAVYWDRRFDAFDPELVAPFWLYYRTNRSYRTYIITVLQCDRTVHGPT